MLLDMLDRHHQNCKWPIPPNIFPWSQQFICLFSLLVFAKVGMKPIYLTDWVKCGITELHPHLPNYSLIKPFICWIIHFFPMELWLYILITYAKINLEASFSIHCFYILKLFIKFQLLWFYSLIFGMPNSLKKFPCQSYPILPHKFWNSFVKHSHIYVI